MKIHVQNEQTGAGWPHVRPKRRQGKPGDGRRRRDPSHPRVRALLPRPLSHRAPSDLGSVFHLVAAPLPVVAPPFRSGRCAAVCVLPAPLAGSGGCLGGCSTRRPLLRPTSLLRVLVTASAASCPQPLTAAIARPRGCLGGVPSAVHCCTPPLLRVLSSGRRQLLFCRHVSPPPTSPIVVVLLGVLTNEGGVVAPATLEPSTSQFPKWVVAVRGFSRWGRRTGSSLVPSASRVPAGVAPPVGFTWIWGRPFQRYPALLADAL